MCSGHSLLHCVVNTLNYSSKGTPSTMKYRHLAIIVTVSVAAVGLAACGSDDAASTSSSPTPEQTSNEVVSIPDGAAFNAADVEFAQGMIPHHEQAIEMAEIALDPTVEAGPAVRDLATRIKGAQDPEIESMTAWLTAWGQPMQMNSSEGHDMSAMDGMMSVEEMDSLGMMNGADFDTMWMQMMVRHHEGAIAMAQTVKVAGSSAEVLSLADQVIAGQQAELTEMQTLLGS